MEVQAEGFAQRVFNAISSRFTYRAHDIAHFAKTQYSFEEWLNWEAFAACATSSGWRAHPKPRYRDLGAENCKDLGDLLVIEGGRKLLVEVGLVHDGTGNKWRDKLAWDVQKLARPLGDVICLHLVVLASASHIEGSKRWHRWLEKVPCWGRPDPLETSIDLEPNGQIIIRGWCGRDDGHQRNDVLPQ